MPKRVLASALIISLTCSCASVPIPARTPTTDEVYIYYFDELAGAANGQNPNLPAILATERSDDDIFKPCVPREQAALGPVLVPLILVGFKIFSGIAEASIAAAEKRRLAALSKTYTQIRSDPSFPNVTAQAVPRCLVVDRINRTADGFTPGSTYVFGLRSIGGNAFTIEPLAARVDATPVIGKQKAQTVNSSVSVSFQTVQADGKITNLPAYSVNFENLALGKAGEKKGSQYRSPVLPISPATAPTSVAVSITESHTSLASETQRIALEQANRAALWAAIGEAIKGAISD